RALEIDQERDRVQSAWWHVARALRARRRHAARIGRGRRARHSGVRARAHLRALLFFGTTRHRPQEHRTRAQLREGDRRAAPRRGADREPRSARTPRELRDSAGITRVLLARALLW